MVLGPKHFQLAKAWVTSAGLWGVAGTLTLFYYTEFRTVLQYVPLYNTKYRNWPPLNQD
ncbi:cytochrome b-c1 complex subunit 10 [Bemisia tabaci]|uniref:cytochrome b-c1 complex subunit 10 n=1 Tax=Bemisia tabaci TaxID=7038 RepID=UPI003B280769